MLSVQRFILLAAFSTLFHVPYASASEVAQSKGYVDELYASFQAAGAPLINALIAGVATVGVAAFFGGKYIAMREFYRLPTPGINIVGREGVLGAYHGANPAEKLAQVVRLSMDAGELTAPQTLDGLYLGFKDGKAIYFKEMTGSSLYLKVYNALDWVKSNK